MLYICPTKDDGCGFIGVRNEFKDDQKFEVVICPNCSGDCCVGLTRRNRLSLVDEYNRDVSYVLLYRAQQLLPKHVCECKREPEDGPCEHEAIEARKLHWKPRSVA